MIYTLQQLIDEWKVRQGLVPLRTDAAFHRFDSLDIDGSLARDIDSWYQNLLDTAPAGMLVPQDISEALEPLHREPGLGIYLLPHECRRIVEVNVGPASPPAVITGPDSALGRRQASPFSRGGKARPVAIVSTDRLIINGPGLERVLAIVTPPEGVYEMDPSALTTINSVKL